MNEQWRSRITIEPGKRGGRPCIRGMRITVYDILSYFAAGMTSEEILDDFPYLKPEDIQACLAFAAERERSMLHADAELIEAEGTVADKSTVIGAVCNALASGTKSDAVNLLRDYRFAAEQTNGRKYGKVILTRVFVRDGFRDRYTGGRLVFPPVLRLLSFILPDEFPYHPNWKTTVTHPAFWELGATIDHVIPVTRGGKNDESNLVTTSMVRNSAKLNYTIEELGWTLYEPGNFDDWDGLLRWFLQYPAINPRLLENELTRRWYQSWHRAAKHALSAAKDTSTEASPGTLETLT